MTIAAGIVKVSRSKVDRLHVDAQTARERVITMIDAIPPEDLVASIKRAPSLRGMILGYIAEEMFEKHLPERYHMILSEHIEAHDDHDRSVNKSDRTVTYGGRRYGIQLKSIQTASICRNIAGEHLQAVIQNDASDRRDVKLADGSVVSTTCYVRGEYDILAAPLFPFTGTWDYAYIRVAVTRMGVGEKAATALALAIHELATNSVKYGSLSSDTGFLDVSSKLDGDDLIVTWTETGGPPISEPKELKGFGSRLLSRSVSGQLAGEVSYDWQESGLVVTIRMRQNRLAN